MWFWFKILFETSTQPELCHHQGWIILERLPLKVGPAAWMPLVNLMAIWAAGAENSQAEVLPAL